MDFLVFGINFKLKSQNIYATGQLFIVVDGQRLFPNNLVTLPTLHSLSRVIQYLIRYSASVTAKYEIGPRLLTLMTFALVRNVTGILPISIHDKPDRPRLPTLDGVPFVPEEFRDYSNVIFNKIDFRELTLMSPEKIGGLEAALLQLIKNETEAGLETPPNEVTHILISCLSTLAIYSKKCCFKILNTSRE